MTTSTITAQQFKDAVLDVLAERGDDFVYGRDYEPYDPYNANGTGGFSCVYSDDGGKTGSCLFGAALIEKLGLPYNPLWEGVAVDGIVVTLNYGGMPRDMQTIIPDLTYSDVSAARQAQTIQDGKDPYLGVREALEAAGWRHS